MGRVLVQKATRPEIVFSASAEFRVYLGVKTTQLTSRQNNVTMSVMIVVARSY